MTLTAEEIRKKYGRLIGRRGVVEETVQRFLTRYPAFLPVLWPYENVVFSKLPLGNQHVVDFAFARENSGGVTWYLIEIERPSDRLFTKAGDPAARLVHGMRQLADWKIWFRDNRDFVRRYFPFATRASRLGLTDPERILIIGRRSLLADRDRLRYAEIGRDAGIQVMTFDRLVDQFSWPAMERALPLRTVRFVNSDISRTEPIAQMSISVKWKIGAARKLTP